MNPLLILFGWYHLPDDLIFDGSKCQRGCGVSVILILLDGDPMSLPFKLDFHYTNNFIEYEALILGIQISITLEFKLINIFGDTQLIVK